MEFITAIAPFVLLIAFWFFIMRRVRSSTEAANPVVERLDQIHEELVRIRRTLESS
jgi:hypothetical protein